jgi:hypothetical protein
LISVNHTPIDSWYTRVSAEEAQIYILKYQLSQINISLYNNMSIQIQKLSIKAKLFRGLGDSTRLSILESLRQSERTTSEIVKRNWSKPIQYFKSFILFVRLWPCEE